VTILVIDAAAAVRSRLVARLREAGLEVIGEATSIATALAIAEATRPRAIVVDIELPGHPGLSAITDLKGCVPEAALVVFTNASPYRRACLAAGADGFLDKSSEFDSVAAAVLGLLT
jgi:DNA-binding NarL/FixJ family response regulator